MNQTVYGRGKSQLSCSECLKKCMPKEGDWFWSANSKSQQYFLCKGCEQNSKGEVRRAVNRR